MKDCTLPECHSHPLPLLGPLLCFLLPVSALYPICCCFCFLPYLL